MKSPINAVESKIAAARMALAEVQSGMTLGLGTGSTAAEFVKLLGGAVQRGLLHDIRATCTSNDTEELAASVGIRTFRLSEVAPLDLAVDGADEIDASLRLIKGKGGALLREKIVEQQAKRFVVIADESKVVTKLGQDILPVEVTPFALEVLQQRFEELGYSPVLRMQNGKPRETDEGHRILDIRIPETVDISDVVLILRQHAGVVETGFFPTEASEAIIATTQGIQRMNR